MSPKGKVQKINKRILKNLTSVTPDFVELEYLYQLRHFYREEN